MAEGDRQQEKMRELRDEVNRTTTALAEERTKGVEAAKMLAEAAKDRMELTRQHHEEMERAKMALNRVQTTYQTQLMQYQGQAEATTILIKQLKDEKQAAEDKSKMELGRIRDIVLTWRDRTKTKIDDCSATMWNQWSWQAVELQILRADAENRKKADGYFYKMDEESIVTIREELLDDFYALAETKIKDVRKLIERLDDDQLDTQLQFEWYERERRPKEVERRADAINISDEET